MPVAVAALFSRASILAVLYVASTSLSVSDRNSFIFAAGVVTAVQVLVDPVALANFYLASHHHFDALRSHGPSPADFAKVKENYLTGLAIRQKENSYWLGKLAQFDENGMDPALIPDYNRKLLAAMTIGDLQQAAARYFDPQRVFEAVLKPETASP